MKANELRIGNWVYCTQDHCQIQITESDFQIAGQFQPIPLSEEWLLQFGFEKVVYDSDQTGYGTEYHLKVNEDVFINYDDDFSCEIFASKNRMKNDFGIIPNWEMTKYVHSFQNIYFALTGEELTLKNND
jgi:hypothetical protein